MPSLRHLIREIHRRSIWQVLGVYLVGSWGALQVVDTLVAVAGLPDWFPTLAVALLVVGLPVVLATAVVQEGIPAEREEREEPEAREAREDFEERAAGSERVPPKAPEPEPEPPRIHHRVFTWKNAIMGGVVAFALWGVVAAGWLVLAGPSALVGVGEGRETAAAADATVPGFLAVAADPPGAELHAVRVSATGEVGPGDSLALGASPVAGQALEPGEYLIRITPRDREPLLLLARVRAGDTTRLTPALPPEGEEADGMIVVAGGSVGAEGDTRSVESFLLDRHEVTNARFLEFVSSGGYEDMSLWPVTMAVRGAEVSRGEALRHLVDRTGAPGPRSWSGGVYPEGEGEHPVVGVSWFEARAYCLREEKRLPTRDEWWRAAQGEDRRFPWGDDTESVDARANFGLEGPAPVGSYPSGVSPFGAFDMAGNVREWVAGVPPEAPGRRLAVGGSWQDPSYAFDPIFGDPFPPDFASSSVGFRCARDLAAER